MKKVQAVLFCLLFFAASFVFAQEVRMSNYSPWALVNDSLITRHSIPIKVPGMRCSGTLKVDGVITSNSDIVLNGTVTTKLTASDSAVVIKGLRVEGPSRQKGQVEIGTTGTTAIISTAGKITTPDSIAAYNFRAEGAGRFKGGILVGTTGTTAAISNVGKITSPDSIVTGKGLRSEGPALVKGDLEVRLKGVINDSLRVEKSTLLKQKLVVMDSLRVEESVLLKQKAVVNDSLRVEKTAIIKGDIAAGGKIAIDDSFRVEKTTLLKDDVTIKSTKDFSVGAVTWTDDDSLNGAIIAYMSIDSSKIDTSRFDQHIRKLIRQFTVPGLTDAQVRTIISDSAWINVAGDTAYIQTAKIAKLFGLYNTGTSKLDGEIIANGKITSNDSLANILGIRTNGNLRAKGNTTLGATATPVYISSSGLVSINTLTPMIAGLHISEGTLPAFSALKGLRLGNPDAATGAGAMAFSPVALWKASGWHTDAGGAADSLRAIVGLQPVSGAAVATSKLSFQFSTNTGALAEKASFSSAGVFTIAGYGSFGGATLGSGGLGLLVNTYIKIGTLSWDAAASDSIATGVLSAGDYGDVTIGAGAWRVEDDSHTHDSTTVANMTGNDIVVRTIDGTKLVNATLDSLQMKDNSLSGTDLHDRTVAGTKLVNGTLDSLQFKDASIAGGDIATRGITATQIANSALDSLQIKDASISGADIATRGITATQIANATLDSTQINTIGSNDITDGQIKYIDLNQVVKDTLANKLDKSAFNDSLNNNHTFTGQNRFVDSLMFKAGAHNTLARIDAVDGADPYIRLSVHDDHDTPALKAVLDIHDTVLAFPTDNTVDIGAAADNRPKDLHLAGKAVVNDSARIEKSARIKGEVTIGVTGTTVVMSTAGKITAADSVAALALRTEGPGLVKGALTVRGMSGTNAEQPVTLGEAGDTFAITKNAVVLTGDTGGNTLATITGATQVGIYVIRFIDDKVTITDTGDGTANTINLSAAFTSSANDIMTLYWNGTSWFEASRSVN